VVDVALHGVRQIPGAAHRRPGRAAQVVAVEGGLDRLLHLVGELEAVGGEELDPVVLHGIVRGGDRHRHRPVRPAQVGHRGGRHDAGPQDLPAARADGGDERGLQHLARDAGVAADHEAAAVARQHVRRGAADPEGQLRRQVDVGDAADAVGPEQPPHR